LKNIGSKVTGEWDRRDFDSRMFGRNCLQQLNADYPWYVRGMYVDDYIGNISTTNALKTQSKVSL